MQNADYSWDDAFCLLRSAICVPPSLARNTAHKKQTPLTPSRGREVLETPAVPPGFRPSTAELKSWKVNYPTSVWTDARWSELRLTSPFPRRLAAAFSPVRGSLRPPQKLLHYAISGDPGQTRRRVLFSVIGQYGIGKRNYNTTVKD